MDSIILQARAKINLTLDVVRKREDGYHDLKMIMQTVGLYDVVEVAKQPDSGITVDANRRLVPTDSRNTAWKAARLMQERYGINSGVRIVIKKNIPVAAGLAGGSSDAAAVLKGLNRLFSLGLTAKDLMSIGREVGADVPYCIVGGTALAEGTGDIITPLKSMPAVPVLLVKPKMSISTGQVFKDFRQDRVVKRPDTDEVIRALEQGRIADAAAGMVNVLETVTARKHKIIDKIKEQLISNGAAGSVMSGSGPTVFGVFTSRQAAENAAESISLPGCSIYLTETTSEEEL